LFRFSSVILVSSSHGMSGDGGCGIGRNRLREEEEVNQAQWGEGTDWVMTGGELCEEVGSARLEVLARDIVISL
jgi:hypothetical protein